MIRTITALVIAASIPVLAVQDAAAKRYRPCNSCGEEIPQFARFIDSTAVPPAVGASKASPRRRAHFYSWQGSCYALDRSRQWRWVDPAFC